MSKTETQYGLPRFAVDNGNFCAELESKIITPAQKLPKIDLNHVRPLRCTELSFAYAGYRYARYSNDDVPIQDYFVMQHDGYALIIASEVFTFVTMFLWIPPQHQGVILTPLCRRYI